MAPRERRRAAGDDEGFGQPPSADTAVPSVVFFTSSDGLHLHARAYGDPLSPWLPVVCLSGLTRSSRDFHQLAMHLAGHRHRPRRVIAFDYRGRGGSQWDPDPRNYNPVTEAGDVFAGMAAFAIDRAVIVGTSRGGIIGMLMAVARPAVVAGLVLNDVGPTIEARGLARIKAYVGRTPVPEDWADAAQIQRRLHGAQFTEWTEDDWDNFARLTYRDQRGQPVADYDPALAHALDGVELDQPMPDLWDEFRALRGIPVMSIRGANSDLLSEATVNRMAAEHPDFTALTVADEGHSPLLSRSGLLNRISAFVTGVEGSGPAPEAVVPRDPPVFDLDTRTG
jgi:pimeloyl-ACP methyl ester carboxylesterase